VGRRTGSETLAKEVQKQLLAIDNLSFMPLDDRAAQKAADIAKTGLRGMDALVIQVAKEFKTELISFDIEMMEKARL